MKSTVFDIHSLDTLAQQDSAMHRVDARVKLFVTGVFVVCVMSMGKYEISALIPFFIYPFVATSVGRLSFLYLLKRTLAVSPFAIMVGIFNPFLDRTPIISDFGIYISGGWISFTSIMIRFILTVEAALILISVTGIYKICKALQQSGVPHVFATQLLLLYRYLFVLVEEGVRILRAREIRTFSKKQRSISLFARLTGSLLLRTFNRSQNIHQAMASRGFQGEIRLSGASKIGVADILYGAGWTAVIVVIRFYNIPQILGSFLIRNFL
jgi:cobalt/nickel transport system permease protein